MQINSNIEQVIQRFRQLAEQGETIDVSSALIVGVNAALGALKFRVFNTGQDAKGVPFGKYTGNRSRATNRKFRAIKERKGFLLFGDTGEEKKQKKKLQKGLKKNASENETYTEYEKERLAQGRQVGFKDLEFTGALRRGIIVVAGTPTRVVAVIPNKKLQIIALGQVAQLSRILKKKVNIWGLSDAERDLLKKDTKKALKQVYARFLSS